MGAILATLAAPLAGSWVITLLVLCILTALAYWLITNLMPPPIQKFAIAILVVVVVIYMLHVLFGPLP